MIETDLTGSSSAVSVELNFPAGLPGFPEARRFDLAPWGPAETPYLMLTDAENPDIGFVLVPPWVFYPDYEFDLDQGSAERLNIGEPEVAVVFCVVNLGETPEDSTVNLLAPIVVNRHSLEAAQVVLPASGYSVHAPLAVAI